MNRVLTALSFLFIVGCTTQATTEAPRLSATEQWLTDFKKEYVQKHKEAPNSLQRQELSEAYRQRLNSYLVQKGRVIDSLRIRVTEINAIGTGFVFCEFEGGGVYLHDGIKEGEEGFELVRSLKEGQDTVLSFRFAGEIQLGEPSYKAVKIEATPIN